MKDQINIREEIQKDSIFIVGRVFAVNGRDIIVEIDKNKNTPHLLYRGKTIRNVSVGLSNYVKIIKGFTEIICKVEGEYLEYDKDYLNKGYKNEQDKIKRKIKVVVFGFYDDERFQHGIKEMPLIDNECRLLTKEEFEKLHKFNKNNELMVNIGVLLDEETQEIKLPVKELFAGHIGIFGNTGSGKSNTLAKIYTELFKENTTNNEFKDKSIFVLIDFNGEYSEKEVLCKDKKIYNLSTKEGDDNKYPISKTEIEKLEILSILLDATEKTQKPFLNRAINTDYFDVDNSKSEKEIDNIKKKINTILNKNDVTFNPPFLQKFITDFTDIGFNLLQSNKKNDDIHYNSNTRCFYIIGGQSRHIYHDSNAKASSDNKVVDIFKEYFDVKIKGNSLTELQKIQFKILNQYYHEILNGYSNQEHISPLMSRLAKRFEMLEKIFVLGKELEKSTNIHVVNLRNVNLEIKKIIPLIICKSNYDEQKNKRDEDENNSLHIIIDEAHNILSENSNRESETWKDYRLETFEEIIKEGRKFGIFLTIASQRPSDISPTIISQLHNYFIHRLMNENDLKAVNKAISYLDKLSFDAISNLSTGSCFIAGQMTQFPISVKINILAEKQQPKSQTIDLNKLWQQNT